MGMGVALSLVREGFEVHAFDLRPEAVQKVVDAGGHRAESLAALGKQVDVLITVVVNAEQTEAVVVWRKRRRGALEARFGGDRQRHRLARVRQGAGQTS